MEIRPSGLVSKFPSQLREKKLFKEEKLALAPCPPNFERRKGEEGGGGTIGRGLDRGFGLLNERRAQPVDNRYRRFSVNIEAEHGIAITFDENFENLHEPGGKVCSPRDRISGRLNECLPCFRNFFGRRGEVTFYYYMKYSTRDFRIFVFRNFLFSRLGFLNSTFEEGETIFLCFIVSSMNSLEIHFESFLHIMHFASNND